MKFLIPVFTCVVGAILTGCATQSKVATMEGRGKRVVFTAPYDRVWDATIAAAQTKGLTIRSTDKTSGYIATHRGFRPHTFGENVGIWVRPLSANETQVEVVSRQAGPPRLWFKNWENDILNGVAMNLTRQAHAAGPVYEPSGVELHRDYDEEAVPAPPPAPPSLP